MRYNIAFQVAALGVVVYILALFVFMKRLPTKTNRYYMGLLVSAAASLALDCISVTAIAMSGGADTMVNQILDKAYAISIQAVAFSIFCYVGYCMNDSHVIPGYSKVLSVIPLAIGACTVPFFQSTFTYDGFYANSTNFGFCISGIVCAIYIAATVATTLKFRKRVSRYAVGAFITASALEFFSAVIQLIFPDIFLISYAVMLICLFLFFTLENPKLSIESSSGLFNRHGFLDVIKTMLGNLQEFSVIVIHFEDYERISSAVGVKYADAYVEKVANDVCKIRSSLLFLTKENQLCILYRGDDKKAVENAYNISFYMNRPQTAAQMEFLPHFSIAVFRCPQNATSADAVLENIEFSIGYSRNQKPNSVLIFDEVLVAKQRRQTQLQTLLQDAVDNDGFDVYYQPIYEAATKRLVSAEALVRLKSEKLGYVSPEEFIPIAEKSGLILQLGMQVFEKACRFIDKYKLYNTCMNFVEINLSGVQCMQHNLADQLMMVMGEYHIPAGFINLEITETAAMESTSTLTANMERIIENGSSFSLDDFGSGYSNVQYIISFPFSVIKLDKLLVWNYFDETNTKAKTVLEANIAMMKKLNLKIVAEGVETKEQVDRLIEIGVDYLQGFYFSKPLSERDFLTRMPALNAFC